MRKFEKAKGFEELDFNLPVRKTAKSAGYDFECIEEITIPPYHLGDKPTLVPTGVKCKMEDDEYLMLVNRSSNPKKKNLIIPNSLGIIDADYYGNPDNDGHMMFAFYNLGTEPVTIEKGYAVGQGIFCKYGITEDDKAEGERLGRISEVQMFKNLKYKDVKPIYKINEYGEIYSKYKKGYLKPKKDKDGYLNLALAGYSRIIYVRVATLVAYNFIGEPPKEMKDPTIDHIDSNILNNHYTNLRWLERSENSSIRKERGKSLGELNHEAKLKENEVIEICELLMQNKLTLKQIGEIYGVTKFTINNIKRKVNWKHITKGYNFPIKRSNK